MVDCKYAPMNYPCAKINHFPKDGKVHDRCLVCENLDKDIQLDIVCAALMHIFEEECCIYNQDEAYDIARARMARKEGIIVT